jgi:hypothetical protein
MIARDFATALAPELSRNRRSSMYKMKPVDARRNTEVLKSKNRERRLAKCENRGPFGPGFGSGVTPGLRSLATRSMAPRKQLTD